MKKYHYFFIVLKLLIVLLIVLNTVYKTNYSPYLREILEDIFTIFVGVMMVFFFWPFKKEVQLDKHDKLIALSAGTLLLITKNYKQLIKEIQDLTSKMIYN